MLCTSASCEVVLSPVKKGCWGLIAFILHSGVFGLEFLGSSRWGKAVDCGQQVACPLPASAQARGRESTPCLYLRDAHGLWIHPKQARNLNREPCHGSVLVSQRLWCLWWDIVLFFVSMLQGLFDRTPDGCWGSVWGNPFFSLSSFTEAESTARATEWCLWGPLESRSSSLRENYSTGIWPLGHSQVVALLSTKTAGFGDRSWV